MAAIGLGHIVLFMLVVMAMPINHSIASTVWAPATDPYPGSPAAAMALLIAAGAPADRLARLFAIVSRHEHSAEMIGDTCTERFLRPGEPIALMVGGHGVSRDLTVPDPWPTPLDPLVIDCWDRDGYHLLRPEVCGNFAYQPPPRVTLPPGSPEMTTQGEQWVGWGPEVGGWSPYGAALSALGFGFIPGAAFSGPVAQSSGILPNAPSAAAEVAARAAPSPGEASPFAAAQPSPSAPVVSRGEATQTNGPGSTNSPISGAPLRPMPGAFETTPNAPISVPEPWCAPLLTLACAAIVVLRVTTKWGRT